MFRATLAGCRRRALPNARVFNPVCRTLPIRVSVMARTFASGPPPLTQDSVQERILDVLSNCDKVDSSKLSGTAKFREDLGLDSLDVVDALFYIEEEFTIQMPDHEADEIKSVDQAVQYILKQPDDQRKHEMGRISMD